MHTNMIDETKINEIRNSVDIVEIISKYVSLVPRGKNFFGVCPFHSDHSPSMSVSKEKQIYTCFSCGASGNVFNFLMDYENIGFTDALKICADKAGIILQINKEIKKDKNQELYDIYELTNKFYVNNINTNYGIEARKYLEKRQIKNDVIKEFGIGLSLPKKDLLTNLLISKKYNPKILEKTGLILRKDQGYIDMYINRIMFPLYDLTGRIVGYSGRVYNSSSNSKYFNTRETEIFKKGELLYNYHRAKEIIRENNQLIVVEGFMDVIRLYTIGIKNVVATMGTAVTRGQALLMKRLSKEIILCFDGDEAGNDATNSCMNELTKIGITPKVIRLENNLDPDEYILKNGKEAFLNYLQNAVNGMEYKMKYFKNDLDLSNNFDMAKYVDSVLNELSSIDNDIYIELSLKKLSQESNLDINYLKNKLVKKEPVKTKKEFNLPVVKDKYIKLEQQFLYYMLNNKEVVKTYINKKIVIKTEKYRILANKIAIFYRENGIVLLADLITYFKNSEEEHTIKELMLLKLNDNFTNEMLHEFIKTFKERDINDKVQKLNEELKKEVNPIKKAEYLEEIIKLKMEEEND